jgi:hypothetical protein
MSAPYYEDGIVTVFHGDCLDVLRELPDASVDSVVTDPPYALEFMGRGWDKYTPLEFELWVSQWAAECLRVLKPGGHMLAFGGSRTWHRLAAGIEDAGFEIRDSIAWLYGSGMPKSLNVSKAIDKDNGRKLEDRYALGRHIRERREAAGISRATVNAWLGAVKKCEHYESQNSTDARVPTVADFAVLRERLGLSDEWNETVERIEAERMVVGEAVVPAGHAFAGSTFGRGSRSKIVAITESATENAKAWEGWGTSLKPAFEPIVCARKPLQGTVVWNVLAYGTGALNIAASRLAAEHGDVASEQHALGRWPTNVVLDETQAAAVGEEGRFFPTFRYEAKATMSERPNVDGVQHPTVKPLDLMRWLVRLVTPAGGVVLEPFAGSGATVEASVLEGFRCIAIEREADYLPLIEQRLSKPMQQSLFDDLGGVA